MYKVSDIFSFITKKYPLNLQEKWDQSGKITFFDTTINKVLVCLDPNTESIQKAIKNGCNLIISHHPIFTKSKDHPLSSKEKELIQLLNKKKISLIALHTCFDNNPKGMNYIYLSKANAFKNIKVCKNSEGSYATAELTITKSTTELVNFVKSKSKTSRVISLSANKSKPIKKIAICCGSGFDVLKQVIEKSNNFDAYLTGDVKWHDWQFAKMYDANVIDIGHDIENIFVDTIVKDLAYDYRDLKVVPCHSEVKMTVK